MKSANQNQRDQHEASSNSDEPRRRPVVQRHSLEQAARHIACQIAAVTAGVPNQHLPFFLQSNGSDILLEGGYSPKLLS